MTVLPSIPPPCSIAPGTRRDRRGKAWGITADLTDPDQVARVQEQLASEHADATLLVNAAGVFTPVPFLDHDQAAYDAYHDLASPKSLRPCHVSSGLTHPSKDLGQATLEDIGGALEGPMSHSPDWDEVSRDDVMRAIQEYDRLGPDQFFAQHGFAPTTTYELIWNDHSYPPKALLGTAYEFATGRRLASGDFEGGKVGAVRVLGKLGFTVQQIRRPSK
jgi:hypothetical protein